MKPIVRVRNLSKQYRLGGNGAAHYQTLRESLMNSLRAPLNFLSNGRSAKKTMWALADVNLDIMPGEIVGIIGCNGAGKSTLLKILSRVTEPTAGCVELYGKVGSLLEVGTGFHPELTGRENIFLNGAILGMNKSEIERKFDEIVAFAEVEKFLDTPVKRYSSGMYVRLAFAVAAHLDPDILIIDEVLSVGDMAFQKKCLEKISSMRSHASTIIIVSHNMIAVKAICERVAVLSNGKVISDGDADTTVPLYEKLMLENVNDAETRNEIEDGNGDIRITQVSLLDSRGEDKRSFEIGESIRVVIEYESLRKVDDAVVYAGIRRPDGFICVGTSTKLEEVTLPSLYGPGVIEVEIPKLMVVPGYYVMDVAFYDQNFEFRAYFLGRKQVSFQINSTLAGLDDKYGVFYQKQNWKFEGIRT